MTREEAIAKIYQPTVSGHAAALVDSLVALGVLKLDETPSVEVRFRKAISPIGQGSVGPWAANIWECIHLSGLKIVEK